MSRDRAGFSAETYDVRPRQGGFVFVELRWAAGDEGSAQDGFENHR